MEECFSISDRRIDCLVTKGDRKIHCRGSFDGASRVVCGPTHDAVAPHAFRHPAPSLRIDFFDGYSAQEGMHLAAIVVDSSEEMRDREEQNLRLLLKSNRITAAAVSHELRTLCGAISLISSHLADKPMKDARTLGHDSLSEGKAVIGFQDSGPGIAFPEHLFQPFRHAADGTGLGLYVSRAVVRSYGGD